MKTIRASSLPRIMACPASLHAPEIAIDTSGDVADLGSAVHAVLAEVIGGGLEGMPDLSFFARRFDVEYDDLEFLSWRGLAIWNAFKPLLKPDSVGVEQHMETPLNAHYMLSGHLDVCAELAGADTRTLVVIDWKTGFIERDYKAQLMGYALLADRVLADSNAGAVKIVTAWPRTGTWDVLDIGPKDILDFLLRVLEILSEPSATFAPNDDHCVYCPRSHECPARDRFIQSAVHALLPHEYSETSSLTPREELAVFYDQAQSLKRALKNYTDAVKASIRKDGPLPLPDGRTVTIQAQARDAIHFSVECLATVAPFLEIAPADVDAFILAIGRDAVTVAKKPLLDAVSANAPQGGKGIAIREAMTALLDAGCVETKAYEKLEVVKNSTLIEKEATQ